jgi:outer membrane receptor protein involved in Fe transport
MRHDLLKGVCGVILFLSINSMLVAGTTGKIAGKATDATTHEPLVGANILVEGTAFGAATDPDGEYYVINLPPGIYTLRARMVGYTSEVVEKVRVQVDLTTKVNFELKSTTVEMGTVIVTAAATGIQKDLSNSERTFQTDQIEALPARDVTSILSTQAGITRDAGGELHIRGGRSSEISYMVDGVQVINALNRSAGISIDDQSIQELKAITGTFNAEYGQALSGVVNIVTKKGSEHFSVNATAYAGDNLSFDKNLYSTMTNRAWAEAAARALITKNEFIFYNFSQNGVTSYPQLQSLLASGEKPWLTFDPYLNKYNPVRHYDLQLNISGPLTEDIKSISYFLAGRYQNSPGYEFGRRYFMPWGLWQPVSDSVHAFAMPDGALVPLSWYKGFSTQSRVFFNFGELSFGYGLYYNHDESYGGGQKYLPDGGRYYYTDRFTHILSASYVFSKSTFLDFKGSFYSNKHKNYLYEDPYDYRYMPTQAGDFQQYVFRPSLTDNILINTNPYDFSYWGNDVNRTTSTTKYFSGSLDLTSQIDKYNMVKTGLFVRFHDLQNDYYALQFSQINYRPVVPDVSSPYHTYYAAKPYELAAYVQDKIEFEELIINIGLRFDYFQADGRVLADPEDPQIYAPFKMDHIYKNYTPTTPQDSLVPYTVDERQQFWYTKTKGKYQFSPRIGISFPITAEGVIHFSYGHFFQNPQFQYLYENPNFWITGAGAQNLVGNANLDAERTVMYEIGLQQKIENLLLHVTGFYRDIRDWVGTGYPVNTYRGVTYYSYVNKDNAVAKGITLSGAYATGPWNVSIDYTYMDAKGTSSNPLDAYNDVSAGRPPRVQLINLNWDQPHTVNLIATWAKDGWAATIVGAFSAGLPYTPQIVSGEATGSNAYIGWRENSERKPSVLNFDLHVSKDIPLGFMKMKAMLDVTNLFDARNARNVYGDTGLPDATTQDYLSRTRLVEISNSSEYFRSPGMYYAPRSISLGVRLTYE